MGSVERVTATQAAIDLVKRLTLQHGEIIFHQSGGCCDGSSPMCYPKSEFLIGDQDFRLGEISGFSFYMSVAQFNYWRHTQVIVDVVKGHGGMFSLENGTGQRFLTRSRVFTDAELRELEKAEDYWGEYNL